MLVAWVKRVLELPSLYSQLNNVCDAIILANKKILVLERIAGVRLSVQSDDQIKIRYTLYVPKKKRRKYNGR